jgi:hypothetical protein
MTHAFPSILLIPTRLRAKGVGTIRHACVRSRCFRSGRGPRQPLRWEPAKQLNILQRRPHKALSPSLRKFPQIFWVYRQRSRLSSTLSKSIGVSERWVQALDTRSGKSSREVRSTVAVLRARVEDAQRGKPSWVHSKRRTHLDVWNDSTPRTTNDHLTMSNTEGS